MINFEISGVSLAPGYSFSKLLRHSIEDISRFAAFYEDVNPLHHDPIMAVASQFRGIIASGPHLMSLFTAMVATNFSHLYPMVGTNFIFDFVAPIYPNTDIQMTWSINPLDQVSSSRGAFVDLLGQVSYEVKDLIRGKGRIMLLHR